MLALLIAATLARPTSPALVTPTLERLAVRNGQIVRTVEVVTQQTVTRVGTRQVQRNGRTVPEQYTYQETVPVTVLQSVAVGREVTIRTAGGRPLSYAAAAESLLRRPAGVVCVNGVADPAVLALLREDVVVLTMVPPPPKPAAPPTP
jgi:hypothetical protein